MGNNWKVIEERDATGRNLFLDVASFGLHTLAERDKVFTIEHQETGEIRSVTTENRRTLGHLIENGQLDDD